jgi:4-hydroxybenzoate polyprenyltransferase
MVDGLRAANHNSPITIHANSVRTWLQLFRAPNLFTVPGDPLAGYLLACYGALEPVIALPILASLLFYASGLLLNDLADLAEDRAERPSRPLPSGEARPVVVGGVMVLLAIGGLVLCAKVGAWTLGVGAALLLTVASYNLGLKRVPGFGALNMGLCRGLSLLLGATAVPHGDLTIRLMLGGRINHLLVAFLLITLFIAAITNLARFETKSAAPGYAKWLPAAVIAGGWASFVTRMNPAPWPNSMATLFEFLPVFTVSLLFLIAFASSAHAARMLVQVPLPPTIGKLIRLLLVIQAAFCTASGTALSLFFASILIALWPVSRAVAKRFYAS